MLATLTIRLPLRAEEYQGSSPKQHYGILLNFQMLYHMQGSDEEILQWGTTSTNWSTEQPESLALSILLSPTLAGIEPKPFGYEAVERAARSPPHPALCFFIKLSNGLADL